MKLALQIVDFHWPGGPERIGPTLAAIAREAEVAGFSAISVPDHVWQSPWVGGRDREQMECYSTLAFLAAGTSRVRLTAMVSGPHLRHPVMLARTVTTLDVLSGGRAMLGVGSGNDAEEAEGSGIPFPPTAERFERLEETIQICLRLWDGGHGGEPFSGHHYRVPQPHLVPQPISRPHPPIMIAGEGERQTLRLVARYGDLCSLRPGPQIPHKLDALRRHCADAGRDYDAIEKTCAFRFDPGERGEKAGELVEQLRGLASMGIEMVYGIVPGAERLDPLRIIGREVVPAVADLPAGEHAA